MSFKSESLTPSEQAILEEKSTERPFVGIYTDLEIQGTYLCRKCGLALFRSSSKFHSGCGWPSFDAEIPGAVASCPDADGRRTEIVCARCQGHLGHVFAGEGFTKANIRHCVNSLSLDFIEDLNVTDTEEAIFAAGCFWGVEYYFKKCPGVLKTQVGYTGGSKKNPTYEEVCSKKSGHFEALRVIFDPQKINFENLTKYFFEIHDPSQSDGQGPDLGPQYLSAIFYFNEQQKKASQSIIQMLLDKGIRVQTQLLPVKEFWMAEDYHQDYYQKTNKQPYCHRYSKIF
jgi:peptide methionine sulfoxide reductase msrA/msrB